MGPPAESEYAVDPVGVAMMSPSDSYVRFLRRKIDKPFGTDSIQTIRGVGYRLRANGGRP